MPTLQLPDGSTKEFAAPVTCAEVISSLDLKDGDQIVGCRVDGQVQDLVTPVRKGSQISFLSMKEAGPDDASALYLLRHSTAHVMAEAIQQVWPGAELVYGPPTSDGFYYDIRFPEGVQPSTADFAAIESRMREIIAAKRPFVRYE